MKHPAAKGGRSGGSPPEPAAPRTHGRLHAAIIGGAVLVGVIALVAVIGPDRATYEEYLQLHEGMTRKQVVGIIGMGDYYHHAEGDKDVTNWVNKDGTYIRAVFDKDDVLVEVSWEAGWDRAREKK